jgi:hypothetical protein
MRLNADRALSCLIVSNLLRHALVPNPFRFVRGIVEREAKRENMQNSGQLFNVKRAIRSNACAVRPLSVFFSSLLFRINNFPTLQNQAS